ncbi:MAG: xanthine dehydrogenase family protein subunit M [Calditrichia bacterium]
MKNFTYLQPKTLKEASQQLGSSWQTALPYAGGTDLLGLLKNETETPEKLVNLKSLPDLTSITYTPGKGLRRGALAKITAIAGHPVIREKYAVLAQAASQVGSPQLRNAGTLGGNLCQRPRCWYFRGDFHCLRKGGDMCYAVDGENKYHCIIGGTPCFIVHPSDPAVALLALDASVTVFSGKNSRSVPLKDFFVLPEQNVERENILKPGEIVTEIQVPDVSPDTKSKYIKFKERDVWDFAVVSVAAVIRKSGNRIEAGKVAFGGVAPKPWLEETVNRGLNGFSPSEENIKTLAGEALKDATPLEHNQYKLPLAHNLLKRILSELA